MRACLLLCAALALAPSRPRAAAERPTPHRAPRALDLEPARLEHIKTQILAKLGLTSRPTPLGAPPRDVVRQILARAADPLPERRPEPEHSMREIIAIAHRGDTDTKTEMKIYDISKEVDIESLVDSFEVVGEVKVEEEVTRASISSLYEIVEDRHKY